MATYLRSCIVLIFLTTTSATPAAESFTIPDAAQPHVAFDGAGRVYVTFLRRGEIHVAVSKDAGRTFSDPVIAFNTRGRASRGYQRGPRIGVDGAGRVFVSGFARMDELPELYLVMSQDEGATWSEPLRINDAAGNAKTALHWMAVARSGDVHLAWLDLRRGREFVDLYYARFSNGHAATNLMLADEVCECCAPGIGVDGAGNPLVAFRDGGEKPSREIYARYSPDGGSTFEKTVQLNGEPSLEDG